MKNGIMNSFYKRCLTLVFVIGMFWYFLPIPLAAQTKKVSIEVLDAKTQQALIGVSISVPDNPKKGGITDMDGKLILDLSPTESVKATYIGYVAKTVSVGSSSSVKILLEENNQALNEVVVVGFGVQKKEDLTGSIGIATAKDLANRPVMLASQALQGLVPGLNITQNNGSMETAPSISIRGTGTIGQGSSSSPLVLIDGVEGDLSALNPQDIDNISVLKDAAASSIYGSKAPFGVILVTTKRGKSGKTVINYNNSFRWNTPILMPESMDSYSFAQYFNAASRNSGGSDIFGANWLQAIKDYQNGKIKTQTVVNANNPQYWEEGFDPTGTGGIGGINNVDWYKKIYRSLAMSQEHNLSFSGGSGAVNYYTSFNYLDQGGLMQYNQDQYSRYGATIKLGFDLTSWAKFNYNNRFIRNTYKRPSAMTSGLYQDIGRQCWPIIPEVDPNGYTISRWILELRDGGTDSKESDYTYQQGQFVLEPIKNWKTTAELNYVIEDDNRHWDKEMVYMHDVNGIPYVWDNSSNVHEDQYKQNTENINLYSEYSYSFAQRHNFKILLGSQYQSAKQTLFGLQRSGVLSPSLPEVDLTTGQDINGVLITPSVNGSRNIYVTMGYFGRLNYDYKGKYLLEANLRYDGSSKFRTGHRWVYSPSVSAGWNIAEENFWTSFKKTIDYLKLRISYGQLSNQNTTSWYPTYASMNVSTSYGSWLFNGVEPNIASPSGTLENTYLSWEKIQTINGGLEYGLFNNRLSGSFDYYVRRNTGMLGPAPEMPAVLGVGVPAANNTDLKDYGFEFQIGYQDQLTNGLSYGIKFLLSDYQTIILKYPNPTGSLSTYVQGRKLGEIWGYQTIGIAKTTQQMSDYLASLPNGGQNAIGSNWAAGDIMYADLNHDGKIDNGSYTIKDHGDLKVIGNSTPRYQFGIDLNTSWKGFDFRAFFQGVMKCDIWQGSYYFWGASSGGEWWSTAFKQQEDYFRLAGDPMGENLNAYYPRPTFSSKNQQTQTKYLQNAAYIRLKNLQLGYTIPSKITKTFFISSLRIYVSGENLWTGTSLSKLFDPETITGGWGGDVYPLSKIYSFGVSVNF